jgi:hypothetical protein
MLPMALMHANYARCPRINLRHLYATLKTLENSQLDPQNP